MMNNIQICSTIDKSLHLLLLKSSMSRQSRLLYLNNLFRFYQPTIAEVQKAYFFVLYPA